MKQYVPAWSTLCLVTICFVCFVETELQSVGQDDLSLLCRPGRPGAWGHSLLLPLPPPRMRITAMQSVHLPAEPSLQPQVCFLPLWPRATWEVYLSFQVPVCHPQKEAKAGSSVPEGRNWSQDNRGTLLHWLAPLGLLADFCIHPRPTSLGMELPSMGWAFLDQLTIKTCPTCAQANLMETITHLGSLYPGV